MKRLLAVLGLVGVVLQASSIPARAQDRIRHTDRAAKKEAVATGTIQEETPSHIVYKAAIGTKEIPAADIIDVTYDFKGAIKLEYGHAVLNERKADSAVKEEDRKNGLSDAIKDYQDLLPKLTGESFGFPRRHVQFKIARLLARQAEADPSAIDPAIDALAKFKKEHPSSWQISACARLLARLQLKKGDADGAQKTYEDLAATPEIPKEIRQEFDLLAADALIFGKKYAQAQQKLKALLKTVPSDDPQAVRIRVHLAECRGAAGNLDEAVKALKDIIAKSTDKLLIAQAYNALGDCYRLNGKPKEALWPYLYVDVIYHQDKQEQLKAMEQLAKLFEDQGDKAYAKQYRDRLKKEGK